MRHGPHSLGEPAITKPPINAERVLALVTEAFGGRGGIAQYNCDFLTALSEALPRAEIEVIPRLAADPPGALPAGVHQCRPQSGRAAFTLAAIKATLKRRPDTIYCGHFNLAPLAAILANVVRARLVIQLHGIEIWRRPTRAHIRALNSADLILCVSRDTRTRTLHWCAARPENVIVLPNTVAPEFHPGNRAKAREVFGLGGDDIVLLTVGRLDPRERYKGHDRVIAQLPTLLAAKSNLVYMISGEGDDRARLEGLARRCGVADRLRFLGYTPRAQLPDLYRAADLFVMPSTGEGFGIVFLEAMACGLPAIGVAEGGATDALGDGQLGAAPSIAEFPAALMNALTTPQPDRMALSRGVRARFGPQNFAARVSGAFRRLHESA